jgi:LysR family transcriptional regulator, low CO2-responsive transcriptional regulator
MSELTLRQLRFLTETARAGSLAGAADQLHLTAPAIAQQLRQLERIVGLRVLERGPQGQRLTEAGRILARSHEAIAAELEAAREEIDELRHARRGTVHMGAVSTAKYFSPHVIAAFQRAHPEVRVTLTDGNRDEVLEQLEGFHIDLAVMGRPPERLDVEQAEIGDHPYVLVAPPEHPLAGRRRISRGTVAGEPFVVREQGSGTRQHLTELFEADAQHPRVALEVTSNETIKQAVMAGLGLALISAHTIAAEVADGRLVVLDVQGLPVRRHWLVVRMARRAVSPVTRELWDFVLTEAGAMLPRVAVEPA